MFGLLHNIIIIVIIVMVHQNSMSPLLYGNTYKDRDINHCLVSLSMNTGMLSYLKKQ